MSASLTLLLQTIAPEIVLSIAASALLLLGSFSDRVADGKAQIVALFAVVLALVLVIFFANGHGAGGLVSDPLAVFSQVLILLAGILTTALAQVRGGAEGVRALRFDYLVIVLIALVGMVMMVRATHFLYLYLGMEMLSLSLYVLAAFRRDDKAANEAALKYFVLGVLSTGIFLFGVGFLYGASGGLTFESVRQAAALSGLGEEQDLTLSLGVALVIAGVAFKISSVPFHMWTPDVYQGVPTPVTAFFAAAPKFAALIVLLRLVSEAFTGLESLWQPMLVLLAALSMVWGAIAAIGQRQIKRLIAYSSIGHMGYALVGLAAPGAIGVGSVLVYGAVYLATTIALFALVVSLYKDRELHEVDQLAGLSRNHPLVALLLLVLLFSLAGIPPFGGFFAKFFVFRAAVNAGLVWLAVLGVVTSVVAAFYYLRLIKTIYVDEGEARISPPGGYVGVALALTLPIVFFFWTPIGDYLVAWAEHVASSLG